MAAVIGRCCLLTIVAAVVLIGCGTERDRQWYKPAASYTTAEFRLDRDECTGKDRVLDEQCMKQRGWVPLTSDREPPAAAPKPAQGPRGPRY